MLKTKAVVLAAVFVWSLALMSNGDWKKGVATTYGWGEKLNEFTKSGEPFNTNDLTAASYQFPIGSYVLLVDQDTGKSTVVRINDIGPGDRKRMIDLSSASWKALGYNDNKKGRTNVVAKQVTPDYYSVPDGSAAPGEIGGALNLLLGKRK